MNYWQVQQYRNFTFHDDKSGLDTTDFTRSENYEK